MTTDIQQTNLSSTTRVMRAGAWCVHVFTASGVLCGLLALSAVERRSWETALYWLFLALVIDGIDGPIARKIGIERVLPRFDGATLDLLVDYFTFVIVPALILYRSELLPEPMRFVAAAAVLVSALHHYCNRDIKTEDGYFVGFPAFWNIAVFYLYRFPQSPPVAAAIVFLLCGLTLAPVKVAHPFRVKKFYQLNIVVSFLWVALAVVALMRPALHAGWLSFASTLPVAYFTLIALRRTVAGPDACESGNNEARES